MSVINRFVFSQRSRCMCKTLLFPSMCNIVARKLSVNPWCIYKLSFISPKVSLDIQMSLWLNRNKMNDDLLPVCNDLSSKRWQAKAWTNVDEDLCPHEVWLCTRSSNVIDIKCSYVLAIHISIAEQDSKLFMQTGADERTVASDKSINNTVAGLNNL